MRLIDRVRALFSGRPPAPRPLLTSGTTASSSGETTKAQEVEKRFAIAFGSWRMAPRGDVELLRAYGENPYLFGPVSTIAESMALVDWCLFRTRGGIRARDLRLPERMSRGDGLAALKADGQLEDIPRHDLLDLLTQPMPGITGFEFWELIAVYLTLLGEALLVKEGRPSPGRGTPTMLNVVPPTSIQRRPDPTKPSFDVSTFRGVDTVGVLDAVWTRRINPADIYTGAGVGPGRALKDELAMDEAMAATARSRYKNGATPDLLLGLTSGQPNIPPPGRDQVKQFARDFEEKHKGTEKAGGVHVFGGDFKAQQLGHTLVESQYVDGRRFNRDTVMQALRMPPEKLGVLENANRSTIDAAETLFQKGAVVPLLNRICAALQSQLVPDFGGDLVLSFVNPVPSDRDFAKAVMVALPGAFKVDEVRDLGGADPLSGDTGEALYAAGATASVPVADAPKNVDDADPARPDGDAPPMPTTGAPKAVEGVSAVQDTALNGAQVTSLLEILDKLSTGMLTVAGAKAVIMGAFPLIPPEKVDAMLAGVESAPAPEPKKTGGPDADVPPPAVQ